jgi:transcriptional regulator with XRE-family HTH domain
MKSEEQSNRYTRRVAELLKYARSKAGLSSRELARKVGTSHSTILAYEAARKVPAVTTMMRLIHACGFSLDFQLSPRLRGDDEFPKGEELRQVLDMAAEFPSRQGNNPDTQLPF